MTHLKLIFVIIGMILAHCALADPHLKPTPEDYLLTNDIKLSTGQLLPAGTRWYRLPDIERLKREVSDGTYKRANRVSIAIVSQ